MKRLLLLLATLSFMTMGFGQDYSFLGSYTSDGTPLYLEEPDEISYETLQIIDDALPESYPVPTYNPQYITSGYDTHIVLEDTADVWVTFVAEGAGYRNVLGFYTYDSDDPSPTKPNKEDITIVFPNVSARGSGGGLVSGDKVKIGRFEPGTSIGWVLLANGWKGQVTPGLWQLYSGIAYNPEADEDLRYHNVLLNDPDNERIILGFEDIRRDYASCDQDFNDAIFYITASPYTAIKQNNYNKITDHSAVSSGNDGGLESNGDLASLIAKRNFDRNKANSFKNTQKQQKAYRKKTYKSAAAKSGSLDAYFPETGMAGTETTYVSSPEDLLAITNASNIFSIDYYQGENRVSAALATETKGNVYNHTKTICDRLNDSKLLDVRTVKLQGHELVYSQLQRTGGELEYALTFSVKQNVENNTIYSLWNLDDYPKGDYLNFQVWGSTMGQVTTIVNTILSTFKTEKALYSEKKENTLPTVFIKNGYYSNGKLHLNIINKSKATWLLFDGNYKTTEQNQTSNLNTMLSLTGDWEEEVIVETGYLFDMGLSIMAENSYQHDALYLADGPWGTDFNTQVDAISKFEITAQKEGTVAVGNHLVERGITAKGEVKETINIFRNLLAGDMQLAVADYKNLQFDSTNDQPLEISLVTNATQNWEERLRYTLEPNTEATKKSIAFSEFKNHEGKTMDFTQLKTIVFSVKGNYQEYSSFSLEIEAMALTASSPIEEEVATIETEAVNETQMEQENSANEITEVKNVTLMNYPNPFTDYTVISFPERTSQVNVTITSIGGQIVYQNTLDTLGNQKSIRLEVYDLQNGFYIYTLLDNQNGKTYQGKILKN